MDGKRRRYRVAWTCPLCNAVMPTKTGKAHLCATYGMGREEVERLLGIPIKATSPVKWAECLEIKPVIIRRVEKRAK